MHSTDRRDIREAAEAIRVTALHMGRALERLAREAPAPVADHLMTCAAACEAMTDKAVMVGDIARGPYSA